MGYLTVIKRLAYSLLVFFMRLVTFLSRRTQLHSARFARIDELASLLVSSLDHEASLPLGISHLNQVLAVRSTNSRRELGSLLVVAPTRGGKGLLATAQ